jgi:large repetitive protein
MARAHSRNRQQRGERRALRGARGGHAALCSLTLAIAVLLSGCTKVLGDFRIGDTAPPPVVDAGKEAGPLDIILTPLDGLQTTEWGGRASFTIVLGTAPQANVAIALSPSDIPDKPKEGSVSPESVTFTPVNWNAPQTVYVTGAQDEEPDGNTIYDVVTSPASSEDPHFRGMDPPDVAVTNVDDDTPGFIVTPLNGLTTTEWGGTATFTVALTGIPRDIVTVSLTSGSTNEAKVTPAALAFSPANCRSPQTVTVTGLDDDDSDGTQMFQIITGRANSADPTYEGLNVPDVQVVNVDDETAGVTITPLTGLVTSEKGLTSTFTVALNTAPTVDVSIAFTSSNTREGTVSPARLTFTSSNWRAPQTVTVTGVEDDRPDGNQPYKISIAQLETGDERYRPIDPPDLNVINIDNESAWIFVTPERGLTTSEDGLSAAFAVVLVAPPEGDVTVDFSSSAPGESSVNPRRITFTPRSWSAPQMITVTGVDDGNAIDGDVAYRVRGTVDVASSDPSYGALPPLEVTLINLDNDTPGVSITPLEGLVTTEGGGKATFNVALRSKPTESVRINLSTSNAAEGTVFPPYLTFTAANFASPQKVTVTGVDDMARDGNQRYSILTAAAMTNDDGYRNLDAPNVSVVNIDDDSPGVIVVRTGDLTTTESGGAATFALQLTMPPKLGVAISVSSTNAAEGEVSPGIVNFSPANWNSPQMVTVTGKDDSFADGAQPYRVLIAPTSSGDLDYQGVDAEDIPVTNLDDETASVIVLADAPLTTTEAGGAATFSIVLGSQPMGLVTVLLTTSRPGEGSVTPNSMIFTSANWRAPQIATVTGVDDMLVDGHQPFFVVVSRTSSLDFGYNNLKPSDVAVVNLDDESPGVNVVAARDLTTTENGATAEFTVALSAPPPSDVTIALRSTLPSEGTVSPATLVFTPTDWNAPQVVTVTGVDDMMTDGTQSYRIILDPPTGDAAYGAIDPSDVDVVNLDNDSPTIQIIPPKIATTTESGGTATFGVYLMARPAEPVVLPLFSNNPSEGALSHGELTFTAANWSTPQWVTVTGMDEMPPVADGDIPYKITVGPARAGTGVYAGRRANDVLLVNLDNDVAGLAVSPAQGSTTEGGIATAFTVALLTAPSYAVTVPIASTRPNEGMPLASSLVFTPANWNAPQTVTVRGIDDRIVDGDQVYRIAVGPTASGDATNTGDPNYRGKRAPDVVIKNLDDDGAAIRVTAAPDLKTSEAGATAKFTVVLASAPANPVTIPLVSGDTSEGTITEPSSGTLVFTAANWSVAQTVTVTGADDPDADGTVPYAVRFQPATGDARYTGRTAADVKLTNIDNDSPGLTISGALNLTTTEAGGTAMFRMVLNKAPTDVVTFMLHSSNTTEGTVMPAMVHFAPEDWNVPQTVTITGQQDTSIDGNQVYAIRFDPAASSDAGYARMVVDSLSVINLDDDMPPATLNKQRRPNGKARRETSSDALPPR